MSVFGLRTFMLLLVLLAGASDGAEARPATTSFYEWDRLDAGIPPGTLLRLQKIRVSGIQRYAAWRILYMTRDYANRPIVSSGVVAISSYASKDPAARTVVAWAHPTTGVARKCAPSLAANPLAKVAGFSEMIGAGHIIVATDYPGLATRGPTGYLVGLGQGRAVIDSVRAARQIEGVGGSQRYALWGYSQGGHAALFAANLARRYAPELRLMGVAAAAPPTDLGALLAADIGTLSGRVLAAFTLHAWNRKYGAPLDALIDHSTSAVVDAVASNCIDDLGGKIGVLTAQKPLAERFLIADPRRTKPWKDLLLQNSLFVLSAGVPAFIAQGDRDEVVRAEATMQFVRASCRAGSRIKFVALKGVNHDRAAKASAGQAVAWLSSLFKGGNPPSTCR